MVDQKQSTYSFDAKSGHLTIFSEVENPAPWDELKAKVKKLTISEGITKICDYAFSDYKKLAEVDFPESLTEVGKAAFSGCKSLEYICLPESVVTIGGSAFEKCSSLKSVNVPDSYVDNSEYGLFYHCSSLETIRVGKHEVLFDRDFGVIDGCYALKEIIVHPENEICLSVDGVLYNHYGLGDSFGMILYPPSSPITTLSVLEGTTSLYRAFNGVFYRAYNLKEVFFPDSIKELGYHTFVQCENLEKIVIGNGCKKICKGFVSDCPSLKHLVIGDDLEEIEADAFKGCKMFETIELSPENQNFMLEDGVLYTCTVENNSRVKQGVCLRSAKKKVEEFVVADGTEVIAENAFFKCKTLKELILPPTVKRIEEGAFCGCSSLKSVTFPDSLEYIGKDAFKMCNALKTVKFNEGLKEIGAYAFYSCAKLERVHLPSTLTSIHEYAFVDCFNLSTIVSDAKQPPFFPQLLHPSLIYHSPFFQCAYNVTLWVDDDVVEKYKKEWNTPHFEVRAKGDTQTPSYRKKPKLIEGVEDVGLYNGKTVFFYKDHFEIEGRQYPAKNPYLSRFDGLIYASGDDDENYLFRNGKLEIEPKGRYENNKCQAENVLISSEAKDGVFYLSVVYEDQEFECVIHHQEADQLRASAYRVDGELLFLVESSNYLMFYTATGKQLWSFDTKRNDPWWGAKNFVIGTTIVHRTEQFEGAFNILTGENLWEKDIDGAYDVVGPDGMLYGLCYRKSETDKNLDLTLLKLDPQTGEYSNTIVDSKYFFSGLGCCHISILGNRIYYAMSDSDVFYGALDLDTLQIVEENVVVYREKRKPAKQHCNYYASAPIVNDGKVYVLVKGFYLNVFDK